MKRIQVIGIVSTVLILLLTVVSPVMAKPVNNGVHVFFMDGSITDSEGHDWYFYCLDYSDRASPDTAYLYSDALNVELDVAGEVSSRFNWDRRTAIFKNSALDITLYGSDPNYVATYGSRRDPEWAVYYNYGPGSIKGTITINSTVYSINFTSGGSFLYLDDYHHIEK